MSRKLTPKQEYNRKHNSTDSYRKSIAKYRKSERYLVTRRIYYELNKERILNYCRIKRKEGKTNPISCKNWRKNNPEKWKALMARRKFLLKASSLVPEYLSAVCVFTKWAKQQGMKVDHIIPIRNPNVCGLNVPWNIQIIPESDNRWKLHWFDPSAYKDWVSAGAQTPLLRPKIP